LGVAYIVMYSLAGGLGWTGQYLVDHFALVHSMVLWCLEYPVAFSYWCFCTVRIHISQLGLLLCKSRIGVDTIQYVNAILWI